EGATLRPSACCSRPTRKRRRATLLPLMPKESPMQYKTIVLELLTQHQQLHERLRSKRTLMRAMNEYAEELRHRHLAWTAVLARSQSDESQIASEALELALEELREALRQESSTDENGPPSLDKARAFIRRHTRPA